jgi:hypothetical protein
MLIETFLSLLEESFSAVFCQKRTLRRAMELALAFLCSLGRRTISRTICLVGRHNQDWSADYKLYSRSNWDCEPLFDPVFRHYFLRYPSGPIVAAMDDTKLPKTGRKIKTAFWQRDPLSPAFHPNLFFGLRFMQTSLIFPHYRDGDFSARALPVSFVEAPAVKKPGKRATKDQIEAYRNLKKTQNLSMVGLEVIENLRSRLDQMGQCERGLLLTLDNSLCNKTIFSKKLDRVDLIARCKKNSSLCFPGFENKRKYSADRFTPEQVRQDGDIPWHCAKIHYGGAWREIEYKQIRDVLWPGGSGQRILRLFVIAPQPYKLSPHSSVNYRSPAYLLSTDIKSAAIFLLQAYFDRWQIEVNHRDEKDALGVGQAQVWSPKAVPRHPAFAVCTYSLLLLASIKLFGPERTDAFVCIPKWRKNARRPSILDLLTLLRKELGETSIFDRHRATMAKNLLPYACA